MENKVKVKEVNKNDKDKGSTFTVGQAGERKDVTKIATWIIRIRMQIGNLEGEVLNLNRRKDYFCTLEEVRLEGNEHKRSKIFGLTRI